MIRSNKKLLLISFLVFLLNTGYAQDLFSTGNIKKFADYLFNTQQYNLAANEYERILIISPDEVEIYPNLLKSYRLGNNCQNSFQTIERINVDHFFDHSEVSSEYLKLALTCTCCYNKPLFNKAISTLDENNKVFYQLGRFVFAEEKDSIIYFAKANQGILMTNYPNIFSNVNEIQMTRGKSPFLAASMSTLFPGSGKAYSGFWGDAMMSLLFVSTNAWISYKGFKKKGVKSASGWIFGSISFGFYIGNIWGSAKAAKNYNKTVYNKLYDEAKNNYYKRF